MSDLILLILEIIGTVSFSVSGSLVAIKSRLDIFGVVFVGTITAVGGGIFRDILLGKTPPAYFEGYLNFILATAAAITVFIAAYILRKKFFDMSEKIERINNIFDALGLAAFSVAGVECAFLSGHGENLLFSVVLGMLTGVGGGILRDVLTSNTPYVLKKHVYALASISGSLVYYILRHLVSSRATCALIAVAVIITLRLLATYFRWSLPKISLDNQN